MDKELHRKILEVMFKTKTSVSEAKKPIHPNQQKIDVHEPEKDEITSKDFEMLRTGKKTKAMKEDLVSETKSAPAGHHFTKSGQLKRGDADQDGPGGRMLRSDPKDKMRSKIPPVSEETDPLNDVDETIIIHTPVEFELQESYNFGDYLSAAKDIVGEDTAIELANYAFKNQDTNIFVEQFVRSDIESKVKSHQNAGHKVSTPKYSTKSGQPYAEYVVTDKEGMRRKYIHHGASKKMENMGPVGKRDE
jgi:hypothetical protein